MTDSTVGAPITLHGSKSRLASRILEHFGPHETYVEPFGGSAAVLLGKPPSKVEVYNDIDGELVNLFRVLRDPKLHRKLSEALQLTPYSRAEFELSLQPCEEPIERARRLMVRQRQSYGGRGERWSWGVGADARVTLRWRAGLDRLDAVHRRLRDVQIEQSDWREVIDRFDSATTLFYADPPYHPDTRNGGFYRHELDARGHRALVSRLRTVKGAIVLSGYAHPVYAPLERDGWERIDFSVRADSSDTRTRRTECLWISRPRARGSAMAEGARATHAKRVSGTTRRIQKAIERMQTRGERVTIASVAEHLTMSREHLSRRYRHLFA